jgi:hypothetical protein
MVAQRTHNALRYARKGRTVSRFHLLPSGLCQICDSPVEKRISLALGTVLDRLHISLDSLRQSLYDGVVKNRRRIIMPKNCPLNWVLIGVTYSCWFLTPGTRALRLGVSG